MPTTQLRQESKLAITRNQSPTTARAEKNSNGYKVSLVDTAMKNSLKKVTPLEKTIEELKNRVFYHS